MKRAVHAKGRSGNRQAWPFSFHGAGGRCRERQPFADRAAGMTAEIPVGPGRINLPAPGPPALRANGRSAGAPAPGCACGGGALCPPLERCVCRKAPPGAGDTSGGAGFLPRAAARSPGRGGAPFPLMAACARRRSACLYKAAPCSSGTRGRFCNGLSEIFFRRGLHGSPLGLHVRHQLELGAAAVQVLALAVRFEVVVALQIIGEEAHAALQRHQLGAPG